MGKLFGGLVVKWWFLVGCFVSPALQWVCFEHNSFAILNLVMGLDVLESLFYALSLWCFEFLHLGSRDFMKLI